MSGFPYRIKLSKGYLYSQHYAAVVNLIPTFGEQALAVDVGGWTVDIMPIISHKLYDSMAITEKWENSENSAVNSEKINYN